MVRKSEAKRTPQNDPAENLGANARYLQCGIIPAPKNLLRRLERGSLLTYFPTAMTASSWQSKILGQKS